MKGVELENAIHNAIERTIITKKDADEAKVYFENMLVNDMIDEVTEESEI